MNVAISPIPVYELLTAGEKRRWDEREAAREAKIDARAALLARDFTATRKAMEWFELPKAACTAIAEALIAGDTPLAGELLRKAVAARLRDEAIDQINDEEDEQERAS